MSYLQKATEMYNMMDQGNMMDAFEKFYHNDVVVIEANGETRNGKEAQRKAIQEWEENIKEIHGGGTTAVTANEEAKTTVVESWIEITDKQENRWKMEEIAVQKWQDDQIIEERFYYYIPYEMQKMMMEQGQ